MSGPDLLERVRMCLAEVGVDPAMALEVDADARVWFVGTVDRQAAWRARDLACWGNDPSADPCCWADFNLYVDGHRTAFDACLATRPCMEDCGRDRSEDAS